MDHPLRGLGLLLAAVLLPPAVTGQEIELPTPEEYAEKAREAERLPLFQSREPLVLTLRTDIEWLRDERSDEEEVAGTVTVTNADGSVLELPVEVRTRGNFRRDKRNCNFPPLRLDFPKSEMAGSPFEGQDKLKLVTPCHDSRDAYQDYVLQEYLVYEMLGRLTPVSNRTRLVEITYEDIEGDYDTRTKIGFLIESNEHMAARNRALVHDVEQFHPARVDPEYDVLVYAFLYMIGNTDASTAFFHNAVLVRSEDGRYMTVPYDFDFSGMVNARYATPDPSLPIRRVTDRLFRGFCRPELSRETWLRHFGERRGELETLISDLSLLNEDRREDMTDFLGGFYEVLGDERRFERQVMRACRSW